MFLEDAADLLGVLEIQGDGFLQDDMLARLSCCDGLLLVLCRSRILLCKLPSVH